jgi:hypothetical protein
MLYDIRLQFDIIDYDGETDRLFREKYLSLWTEVRICSRNHDQNAMEYFRYSHVFLKIIDKFTSSGRELD